MEEAITMSRKELDRFAVLEQVRKKQLTQRDAAEILGISDRQIRNLLVTIETHGAKGMISKKRGQPSNNQKPKKLKDNVLSLVNSCYAGTS